MFCLLDITCNSIRKSYFVLSGLPPPTPDLLFVLPQKVSKKHLTRPSVDGHPLQWEREKGIKCLTTPASLEKLTLSWLKPSKPAYRRQARSFVAQTGQFQTPTSLVFRFTGRCHSLANCLRLNSFCFFLKIFIKCATSSYTFDLQR